MIRCRDDRYRVALDVHYGQKGRRSVITMAVIGELPLQKNSRAKKSWAPRTMCLSSTPHQAT